MQQVTTVGTVKKLHRLLGQAFVELERKGVVPRNPANWANVPQVAAPSADMATGDHAAEEGDGDSSAQALDERQAESFLGAARALADEQERRGGAERLIPERCWAALWHALLGAGLRPGEAFALQ